MKTTLAIFAVFGIALCSPHETSAAETPAGDQAESKEERAMKDLDIIHTQLITFEIINGRLPTEAEGISSLVTTPDPENLPRWRQLLAVVPKDPWGREYGFRLDTDARRGFVVFSHGSDPKNADNLITTK
jgi:type II secretion system protein G